MNFLPQEIVTKIYEFDSTYRTEFDRVLSSMNDDRCKALSKYCQNYGAYFQNGFVRKRKKCYSENFEPTIYTIPLQEKSFMYYPTWYIINYINYIILSNDEIQRVIHGFVEGKKHVLNWDDATVGRYMKQIVVDEWQEIEYDDTVGLWFILMEEQYAELKCAEI